MTNINFEQSNIYNDGTQENVHHLDVDVNFKKRTSIALKFCVLLSLLVLISPFWLPLLGITLTMIPGLEGTGVILSLSGFFIGIITTPVGLIMLLLSCFVIWLKK